MTTPKKYLIRQDLAYRQLADQMVIVDPRGGVLHTLTEVGCFTWQQMEKGNHTASGMVTAITSEFEVEEDQAREDLARFLGELESKGLVSAEAGPRDQDGG